VELHIPFVYDGAVAWFHIVVCFGLCRGGPSVTVYLPSYRQASQLPRLCRGLILVAFLAVLISAAIADGTAAQVIAADTVADAASPTPTNDTGTNGAGKSSFWLWVALSAVGIGLVYSAWRAVKLTKTQTNSSAADPDTTPEGQRQSNARTTRSKLGQALARHRGALIAVAAFSGLINILMLTGATFMLEVYDRVLPSRSEATLIALALLALFLYSAQGVLDIIRGRLLARIGASFDTEVGPQVFNATYRLPSQLPGGGMQALQDHDRIRGFVGSPGPIAFFDLPWMPIYLAVIFALHPILGWTALGGAVILVIITFISDVMTKKPMQSAAESGRTRYRQAEIANQNADVILSMGMGRRLADRWRKANAEHVDERRGRRHLWRPELNRKDPAPRFAIRSPRRWRLSGHPTAGQCGRHHRKFNSDRARTQPARPSDRPLEKLRWHAAKLGAACALVACARRTKGANAARSPFRNDQVRGRICRQC